MHRSDPDAFEIRRTGPPPLPCAARDVVAALSPLVTDRRRERIREVVAARATNVTAILEDIADPHNASAILRSADAFGVQHVHVIPGINGFHASRSVAKGTHHWLDVYRHESAAGCVGHLRERGFRVLVASMEGTVMPEELAKLDKVAIVFGNEHKGPTPAMRDLADGTYAVPMKGFVESLNVSVAAGITLYEATRGRRGELPDDEREILEARYLLTCVRDSERVVRDHLAARR
ncbi:MAG: RNA methyltransferase [Sandaracinus sp.]|nr:RNA methyltransferase [Sandaracinus sp.]